MLKVNIYNRNNQRTLRHADKKESMTLEPVLTSTFKINDWGERGSTTYTAPKT